MDIKTGMVIEARVDGKWWRGTVKCEHVDYVDVLFHGYSKCESVPLRSIREQTVNVQESGGRHVIVNGQRFIKNSGSEHLVSGDRVYYKNGDTICEGTVQINDPFKHVVSTSDDITIGYQVIIKASAAIKYINLNCHHDQDPHKLQRKRPTNNQAPAIDLPGKVPSQLSVFFM